MPKVSVIIPNYNHAQFLEQRLDSVLNQTYQDFEVIFLDDASTDNSREIIAKYANHPKISHFVFNETNSGSPFKQWEKVFNLAEGEYIWIAESDDYSELNFLEKLVSLIQDNVAIVYCRSAVVNEHDKIFNFFWADELNCQRWKHEHSEDGLTEIINCFVFRNVISNASSAIFKKEWAYFDFPITEMRYTGDWLFWINLLREKNRKISYIPEQLNFFRKHSGTTRSVKVPAQEVQRFREYFIVLDKAFKISNYNFFSIIFRRKKWLWIFDHFYSVRQILSVRYKIFPPFSYLFLLLYYEYLCSVTWTIVKARIMVTLSRVKNSLALKS